jgi:hypothetical protein
MKYCPFFILLFVFYSSIGQDNPAENKPEQQDGDFLLGLQVALPRDQMKKAVHNKMADVGIGGSIYYLTNPLTWAKINGIAPFGLEENSHILTTEDLFPM